MTQESHEMSETTAIRIAQEECLRKGIEWREPYAVRKRWRSWEVRMPSDRRGGNATIRISRTSGQVKIRFFPR